MLDEALAHDNRLLLLQLTYVQTRAEQVAGRGASSRSRLEAQRSELPEGRFGALHAMHMSAVMSAACWIGEHASAREYLGPAWAKFLSSPVRRYATMAIMARSEHARFVLNEYVALGRQGDPFPVVEKDLEAFTKIGKVSPRGLHNLDQHFCARIAWLRGDRREAIELFRQALHAAQAMNMVHAAARDQLALGILLGDGEGAELRSDAEQRMRELGVADVAADLNAYFPELAELR
jgi:hypothetical protein